MAGVQKEGFTLHSLKLGVPRSQSPPGASPGVLKREERWASGAYQGYVGNHGRDTQQCVSGKGCKKG